MTSIVVGFSGRQMIVLNKVLCPNNVSMQEVGEVKTDYLWVPWGAMFLAHVSAQEREYMLGHMEPAGNAIGRPMTDDELSERMHAALSMGYVDDEGSQIARIRRVAAPIYGPQKQLVAALAVATFTTLLDESRADELIAWLKDRAANLSSLLQVGG
jgi:DNA-binding IclR family transcriptional regulator